MIRYFFELMKTRTGWNWRRALAVGAVSLGLGVLASPVLAQPTEDPEEHWGPQVIKTETANEDGDGFSLEPAKLKVEGSLEVDGGVDLKADTLDFGTEGGSQGMRLEYDATTDRVLLQAIATGALFEWWDNWGADGSAKKRKMLLDGSNVLSLYDSAYDSQHVDRGIIELVPGIVSGEGASSIKIDDVELKRFSGGLKIDGQEVLVKGGTYTQEDLFGTDGSLAVGSSATNAKPGTGTYVNSIALGEGAATASDGQVVLGRFNEKSPYQALQIGGGEDDANRFNALTVDSDGDTRVGGNLYVAKNAKVNGILFVEEAGGLSMGSFKTGGKYGFDLDLESYLDSVNAQRSEPLSTVHLEQLEEVVSFLKTNFEGGGGSGTSLWEASRIVVANSHYNAGTGATVYALGGMNNHHFTKSGGTWSADGISFSGGSDQVSMPDFAMGTTKRTVMFYADLTNVSSSNKTLWGQWAGGTGNKSVYFEIHHQRRKVRISTSSNGSNHEISSWSQEFAPWSGFSIVTTRYDAGAYSVWLDGTNYHDTTLAHSSLKNSNLDVDAYVVADPAVFRAYVWSDIVWTDAQLRDFESLLQNLDWD